MVSFSSSFCFIPLLSCPDEGHVGGWVEGIREEARVEGIMVVVVEQGQGREGGGCV